MTGYAIVPLLLLLDKTLSRTDGFVLLLLYGLYLYRLITQKSYFPSTKQFRNTKTLVKDMAMFLLGILLIFGASQVIVKSSIIVAESLNIPVILIGLVLVSAGTTLPELAHGLQAVKLNKENQVLGDILGSIVANSTIVLGIAAIITPIEIESLTTVAISAAFLLVVLLLFLVGVYTNKKLNTREALILLSVYILFLLSELGLELIYQATH
jgi:cation:H+ antiporter